MKSLLIILGTILIIAGSAAMLLFIIVPAVVPSFNDAPFLRDTFQTMFCKPGETLKDAHQTYRPEPGKTVTTVSLSCVNNENQVTEVDDKPIIYGTVGFIVPFLVGLFMVITGANMKTRKMAQAFAHSGFQEGWQSGLQTNLQTGFSPTDWQQQKGQGFSLNAMGIDINMDENGEVVVKTPDGRVLKGHQMQVNAFGGIPVHLTERLKDLKSALDSGLITQTEYDTKRQEILREM